MSAGSASSSGPGAAASGSGSGSGGSGIGGGGGPCGACKFLRRKCVSGCIFAPYFDSEQGAAHFAAVHKVFGASNVSKLLRNIPAHKRLDAVVTICYEAQSRLRDPVYGCVAHIFALQQQAIHRYTSSSFLPYSSIGGEPTGGALLLAGPPGDAGAPLAAATAAAAATGCYYLAAACLLDAGATILVGLSGDFRPVGSLRSPPARAAAAADGAPAGPASPARSGEDNGRKLFGGRRRGRGPAGSCEGADRPAPVGFFSRRPADIAEVALIIISSIFERL
ncbi:LOB domain-containing protein 30 [Apostasia shenzhenica]|uniref:LOB domain-containing protein 30 n=1 Tax=Apostasia shenzhenica TaxID=1088818 RepID=A0A2I0B007_9ASPA|nr:LOB domain-containing protein 30 [Apostasia shenzhenica]